MVLASTILPAFGLQEDSSVELIGSGLINNTWKVTAGGKQYILQRVNQSVFEKPGNIAFNIHLIADYLEQHHPKYKFVAPLKSREGEEILYLNGEGFFRLFPFVQDSYSLDVVQTPGQAYEAARQFGRFTKLLSGFDASQLKVTIPSFHDLGLRYQQFLLALEQGDQQRIRKSADLVKTLITHANIATEYKQIANNKEFKLRVTHHDTKISNVLFDAEGKGLCVIDLDTVMPGYFISDVGDMMRTYISPVSEEECDFEKIEVRDEFYQAIVQGYYSEMKDELTATESSYFFYAAKFMIYMQALRFLTDYFTGDVYYGAKYPDHNLFRANNQIVLLQRLLDKEKVLRNKGI
jgi:Ser/Thr protein kinase RdoA (MazF antagonist)